MAADRSVAQLRRLGRALPPVLVPRQRIGDVRRRIAAEGIASTLVLCATPRSGSTMLSRLLASSGLVGRAEELFHQDVLPPSARTRPGAYLAGRARQTGRNGVLGLKLHWYQAQICLGVLSGLRGAAGLSDRELLEACFPRPRFLWLERRDVVAQGVSAWKLKTTGIWLSGRPARSEPWFDFEAIRESIAILDEQARAWGEWFAANEIDPLPLVYEDVVADPTAAVRAVLDFLGVAVPDELSVELATRRQADALSEEWIRRYRELAERP